MPDTPEQLKADLAGTWVSLAPELRPSSLKSPDGTIKPFYLTREFSSRPDDQFELTIVNFADPYGRVPIARLHLGGHMRWRGPHDIAPGAWKVDFVADVAYDVTPLAEGFAEVLNRVARDRYAPWQVNGAQSVLGKAFVPFGLAAGQYFQECDLIYLQAGCLFWGARHVDGRPFDSEANRPTNLQIPLVRR